MEFEVQGYLTELGILRGQTRDAIRGLDDEAANWRPIAQGTNSIYAMLSHLIGSQNHWVREVINGEAIARDREAEFRTSGGLSEIMRHWEKVCSDTDVILGKLSLTQLADTRNVSGHPEWGNITVRWCVLHMISHLAIHLGHIQLTRQMWEQQNG